MDEQNRPHSKNVAGPFYVVDGCCTSCGVPMAEAPSLFAYDEEFHCFVKQQPVTKPELRAMMRATWAAELQCLRYRGRDPDLLRRFAEMELANLCDESPLSPIRPVFRNHVTFDAADDNSRRLTANDLVVSFQEYLRSLDAARGPLENQYRYKFTPIVHLNGSASFSYSWFRENYHRVNILENDDDNGRWLVHHSPEEKAGSRGVSNQLEDWLLADGRFCSFRWYSAEEWNGSKTWQETVW
jgi:hypothetical protein